MKNKNSRGGVSAAARFYSQPGIRYAREIATITPGVNAKLPCPDCGRVVEWVNGRTTTHGPSTRGMLFCPGTSFFGRAK